MKNNSSYLIKAKRTDNDEWVVGNYVECVIGDKHKHFIVPMQSVSNTSYLEMFEVDNYSISQSTRTKDMRGNIVFENDIIQIEDDKNMYLTDKEKEKYYIVWSPGGFDAVRSDSYHCLSWIATDDFVIIGNISDNDEYEDELGIT